VLGCISDLSCNIPPLDPESSCASHDAKCILLISENPQSLNYKASSDSREVLSFKPSKKKEKKRKKSSQNHNKVTYF
jgi:hypothetical protein